MASLDLQKPTNRTVAGPRIAGDARRVVAEYDFEQDDGSVDWCQVVFEEVLGFDFRQESCCAGDDVVTATEVTCLTDSKRLRDNLSRWQEAVGWQDWQQLQGGSSRFKHFKMFFDGAGCLDVIAASCKVSHV